MLAAAIILSILLPCLSYAGASGDAVMAIMKLEARCEAGISHRDFAPAIGEAKFAVNVFLKSKEAADNIKLAESINKVMAHYMAANLVWRIKLPRYSGSAKVEKGSIGENFLQQYPEIDNFDKTRGQGGIVERGGTRPDGTVEKQIYVAGAVGYAIKRASEELKIADSLLSRNN